MSENRKQPKTAKAKPAPTEHLDPRTILVLRKFVEKLGGIERAKEAVERLEQLQKAA